MIWTAWVLNSGIGHPGIRLLLLNGCHARSSHWKDTPFHWFWGKNTPYFSENEDFCCKKNHPFFRFQGEHIAWWSLLKQIEDIHYSCNTFFVVWFSSCFLLAVVTLEHYISCKCIAIANNLGTQFSALTWSLTLQGLYVYWYVCKSCRSMDMRPINNLSNKYLIYKSR